MINEIEKKIKDDILIHADKLLYYNNLLIEQCDRWLSAEEGNRNMERRIRGNRKRNKGALKLIKWKKKFKFIFHN